MVRTATVFAYHVQDPERYGVVELNKDGKIIKGTRKDLGGTMRLGLYEAKLKHNSLIKNNGKLCFLDFEYFGRDDPVKLMADFIWHPGMDLNTSHKIRWLKGTCKIFEKDLKIYSRFHAAWPLYGLRWSLILLNEFLEDGWYKRAYANDNLRHRHKNKLANQLIKAKDICEQIQVVNLKCPYV